MDKHTLNGNSQLEEFETPFSDKNITREEDIQSESFSGYNDQFLSQFESPFAITFETESSGQAATSPAAGDFVNLLGELHDDEFGEHLYEMALELEDTWNNKVSDEVAMGERFLPFATQEATRYFDPLLSETTRMIDMISSRYSGNNLADQNEEEIERFFETLEFEHQGFSPAQEQFFGSILKKVKSVVKTGVNLAKKGVAAV